MSAYSLAESPTGLVHRVQLLSTSAVTVCGRDVNWETWTRIRQLDNFMQGKGRRTIREKIELPTCDRCFG